MISDGRKVSTFSTPARVLYTVEHQWYCLCLCMSCRVSLLLTPFGTPGQVASKYGGIKFPTLNSGQQTNVCNRWGYYYVNAIKSVQTVTGLESSPVPVSN